MKRLFALLLACVMMLALAACGGKKEEAPKEETKTEAPKEETKTEAPAETKAWEPAGSIDFVCPYSAGGGSDVCARTIATVAGNYTSANAVVQNLSGGGGLVGTSYVYGKAGDDMTLCTYAPGQLTAAMVNESECTWDALTQICLLALEEQTLCVQPGKFEDLNALIEYSKANPGAVTLAGTVIGNEDHMCVELLNKYADAGFTYVTYDSAGDILTAIMGGHITGGICNPSECMSQVASGDVDCLCSFSKDDINHIPGFEEVPTAMSYGYDIDFVMFRGVAGAPDMSDEALAYWIELFEKVSQDPAWTEDYLGAKGMIPAFIVGDELADFMANQQQMYYDLQKQVGLIK